MNGTRNLLGVLHRYWGYDSFRSCQEEVVRSVLEGKDGLVVMATGGGKSMCYQLPPLVANQVAVVISPLISLMEDQVQALNARGLRACYLGSAQLDRKVKEDAWKGGYTFVYMTPELAANSHAALSSLDKTRGICVLAIDEAHCVSEWGHEFRPDYRNLGQLRAALPNTPILALTATANRRVQDDIVANLQLRRNFMGRWVTGFERTNLSFSVAMRHKGLDGCFEELLQQWRSKGAVEPTLVYVLTVAQVKEIAVRLELHGMKGQVLTYHAQLPVAQRKANHTAFLNDDVSVMVATVAYGMGIDKPNIRTIIHVGCPSSLEAYYQQAGRAGRDGALSRCRLFWSHQDLVTNETIKRSGWYNQSSQHDPFQERRNAVISFCSSTNCRHADLVNYFQPGTLPPTGRCKGGCDNCMRQASGQSNQKDFKEEAALMLAVLRGMNGYYGVSKAVQVLRGSTANGMPPHLMKLRDPASGKLLHGAGRNRSDGWWKGLATLLVNEGLASTEAKKSKGFSSFVVYVPTVKGLSFLNKPTALLLTVPASMQEAAPVSSLQDGTQQALSAEAQEVQRLEGLLRAARKHVADCLGHAPTSVVTEATIQQLARVRPARHEDLVQVPGMSEAAVSLYGKQLLQVVVEFCAASKVLSHGMGWNKKGGNSNTQSGLDAASTPPTGRFAPLAKKLLSEPKGGALDAYQRFKRGETVADIANKRPNGKTIQCSTVVGYIADCAGAGFPVDFEEVARQGGLTERMARVISRTAQDKGDNGLSAIKGSVEAADYGQVKLTIAMMAMEAHWFSPASAPNDDLDLVPHTANKVEDSSRTPRLTGDASAAAPCRHPDAAGDVSHLPNARKVPSSSPEATRIGAASDWIARKGAASHSGQQNEKVADVSDRRAEVPQHSNSKTGRQSGSNTDDIILKDEVQISTSTRINAAQPIVDNLEGRANGAQRAGQASPDTHPSSHVSQEAAAPHASSSLADSAHSTPAVPAVPSSNDVACNLQNHKSDPALSGPTCSAPQPLPAMDTVTTSANHQLPPLPMSPPRPKIRSAWFYGSGTQPQSAPILRLSAQSSTASSSLVDAAAGNGKDPVAPGAMDITRLSQSHLDALDPIPCLTPVQPEESQGTLSQQASRNKSGLGAARTLLAGNTGEKMEVCMSADVDRNDSSSTHCVATQKRSVSPSPAKSTSPPQPASPSHASTNTPADLPSLAYPPVKLVKRAAPSFLGGVRKRATTIPVRSNLGAATGDQQPTRAGPEPGEAQLHLNASNGGAYTGAAVNHQQAASWTNVSSSGNVDLTPVQATKPADEQLAPSAGHQKSCKQQEIFTANSVRELLESHGPMTATALVQRYGSLTAAQKESMRTSLQSLVDEMEVMRKGGRCMVTSHVDLDDPDTMYLVI